MFKTSAFQKPSKSHIEENKSENELNMLDFKEYVFNDELNEQMGTIHEAYLQCKEELEKANKSVNISTYVNTNFKEVIGYSIVCLTVLDFKNF